MKWKPLIIRCQRIPAMAPEGTGGTYFLYDSMRSDVPALIFKPRDEEPNAPNNPRGRAGTTATTTLRDGIYSETLCLREVAAYLLDREGRENMS